MTNYITKTIKNGVEANIPVTSVNGQYGDVVVAGKEYNAGEGIAIGAVHSDMQGPAPDGFHVPLTTERQAVYDIWTALGGGSKDGTNFGIALKLPFAGSRSSSSTDVSYQGTGGYYWSSSRHNTYHAYSLFFSSSIYPQAANYRAYGFSVRCFKNSPVIPTSSWTKLYGTSIESGGIFWNSTDGLISLSSNGTTWITIADKNLGATTVWNSGDTLSEANCGKYYQRGNNHGFPRTGTIANQSTTQVDASSYGPGNYYSSDTFIKYGGRWDTTDNGNLWGGVSQGTWISDEGDTINNTGVLSVNGQTGNVIIQTGGNYTAGNGIDITNDEIGLDGTYEGKDYSAMQGPAPDGFHVPLSSEWVALCGILTSTFGLASNATIMGTYLKMPMAGYRYYTSPNVSGVGDSGMYWSCTSNPREAENAYRLVFASSYLYTHNNYGRTNGMSIRCFKDTPVIPTSSWTTLYDGSSVATGAGVFYNVTDGLISVSGDGTTWYTIMDKNLGATTVFNQGDTVSDANSGYFYQWGNNYGFPHSGTVTTSSTQVDASTYGPGNYYSSNTFITRSSSPYGWDSSNNSNLRGGVTGVQTASGNLVLGDKLYKIVTSTTAPASGTASNVITIVTD